VRHYDDGAAYCWGANDDGQLGNGELTQSPVPVAVSGGYTFSEISAGDGHGCAVTDGGDAYCWGSNLKGQLGQPGL
jgi:alpha-tubulin suppressor-like RCC1 family protein